jgi:hypothetical protein
MEYQVRHLELAHGVRFKDRTAHPLDQLMTYEAFLEYLGEDEDGNYLNFNSYYSDGKETIASTTINKGRRYAFLIRNDYPIDDQHLTDNSLEAR